MRSFNAFAEPPFALIWRNVMALGRKNLTEVPKLLRLGGRLGKASLPNHTRWEQPLLYPQLYSPNENR